MTEWLYSVLASFIVFSYSLTHCLGLDGLKISFTVGLAPKGARERWVPFEKFYDCVVVYSDVHYYMRAVFCFSFTNLLEILDGRSLNLVLTDVGFSTNGAYLHIALFIGLIFRV